ncbi:hypothetical protein L3073_02115 [Ancylomarina sp. DW003]|nr:hypothetical protein [Ancylomarina sp. DW003]MDE5420997.1 hypothetical protein [Ancylomarina sp. DW003]
MKTSLLLTWFNFVEEDFIKMGQYDFHYDLLLKTGYPRSKFGDRYYTDFRYRVILKTLTEMKSSRVIFLSKTGINDFYKIGFYSKNSQLVVIELKRSISVADIKFNLVTNSIDEIERTFSFRTTKKQAYMLLSRMEKSNYPIQTIEFILQILKR